MASPGQTSNFLNPRMGGRVNPAPANPVAPPTGPINRRGGGFVGNPGAAGPVPGGGFGPQTMVPPAMTAPPVQPAWPIQQPGGPAGPIPSTPIGGAGATAAPPQVDLARQFMPSYGEASYPTSEGGAVPPVGVAPGMSLVRPGENQPSGFVPNPKPGTPQPGGGAPWGRASAEGWRRQGRAGLPWGGGGRQGPMQTGGVKPLPQGPTGVRQEVPGYQEPYSVNGLPYR